MKEKKLDALMAEYRAIPRTKESDLDKYKASRARTVTFSPAPRKRSVNKKALFGAIAAVIAVALIVPLAYFLVNARAEQAKDAYDANDFSNRSDSYAPSGQHAGKSESVSDFAEEEPAAPLVYREKEDVQVEACDADEYLGTAQILRLRATGELVGYRYLYAGEEIEATVTVYAGNVRLYDPSFPATLTLSGDWGAYVVRYSSGYEKGGKPYRYVLSYEADAEECVVEATCARAYSPADLIDALKK